MTHGIDWSVWSVGRSVTFDTTGMHLNASHRTRMSTRNMVGQTPRAAHHIAVRYQMCDSYARYSCMHIFYIACVGGYQPCSMAGTISNGASQKRFVKYRRCMKHAPALQAAKIELSSCKTLS